RFASAAAAQRGVNFVTRFTDNSPDGQEQARQKPIKTRGRNSEYKIGAESHQKVAQEETQENAAPGLLVTSAGDGVGERANHALQPVKIQISDDTSGGETEGWTPSQEQAARQGEHDRDGDHVAANALERSGIELLAR